MPGAPDDLFERTVVRCPTGYGRQTALLAPRLAAQGHDVAIAAFHGLQGAPLTWTAGPGAPAMPVYPGSSEDPFARDIILGHCQHFKADMCLTLMDAWVLDPARLRDLPRPAHWMPVDCEPLSQMDKRILTEGGAAPVAMSRFGQQQLAAAGWPDAPYAPHAVDTGVFAPLPDRDQWRERMGLTGRFVIAVNAANQDPVRKGFGEQLTAYAALCKDAPEAVMLIHTRDSTVQGVDLRALIASLGLAERVVVGDQYNIAAGMVPDADMARFAGMADVVSNCSYGEGFGLAVLEAQAAGTPVVVTDCSAMTELCGSGWLVDGARWWNKGHSAWWTVPSVDGIFGAYWEAYELWQQGALEPYREKAREFALAYDADLVAAQFWPGVLETLAGGGQPASIQDDYKTRLAVWSDVQDCLERLRNAAASVPGARVLELGVRSGNSTAAFLAGAAESGGHVWSADIAPPDVPAGWAQSGLWTFIPGDDLTADIPPGPYHVLFIDSSHHYAHTLAELRKFVPLVTPGGKVLLHDTRTEHIDGEEKRFPVRAALDAFCAETGLSWTDHDAQYGLGEIVIPRGTHTG